jgi:hypothetical protein
LLDLLHKHRKVKKLSRVEQVHPAPITVSSKAIVGLVRKREGVVRKGQRMCLHSRSTMLSRLMKYLLVMICDGDEVSISHRYWATAVRFVKYFEGKQPPQWSLAHRPTDVN